MKNSNKSVNFYIGSFRRGEEEGFSYVFDSCYLGLYYFGWLYIKDRSTIENIIQETFLEIWKRHQMYSTFHLIKSSLYETVRYISLARLSESGTDITYIAKRSMFQDIIRAEVIQKLHEAIQTLPKHWQRIFILRYINGKSVLQIAEETQLSVNVIQSMEAKTLALLQSKSSV